jgi:myo-inositol-1(or 4)-monophosphatase
MVQRQLDQKELAEAEAQAAQVAWGAGRILMAKFLQPLTVKWKGNYPGGEPVTEVDCAVEDYVQKELLQRFPGHAVLGEEGAGRDSQAASHTWVVDPLDGTINYINGLPAFGCSIGLLEYGVPVVGVVFIPWPCADSGLVLCGHVGGGAWIGERRLVMRKEHGLVCKLAVLPRGTLRLRGPNAKAFGERRPIGSFVYEMAAATQDIYSYVLYNSPRVWDVAAGIVLIQEAGGVVMTRSHRKSQWVPFESFDSQNGQKPLFPPTPGQTELRKWSLPVLGGEPAAVRLVAEGSRPLHPLLIRAGLWARRRLGL